MINTYEYIQRFPWSLLTYIYHILLSKREYIKHKNNGFLQNFSHKATLDKSYYSFHKRIIVKIYIYIYLFY